MESERARKLLISERARIERALRDLKTIGDPERGHVNHGMADEGSDLFEQERDAGLTVRLRDELEAVERAERRLAEGTYGLSIESGSPIPDERLEVMPWADRTVEEQARLEGG